MYFTFLSKPNYKPASLDIKTLLNDFDIVVVVGIVPKNVPVYTRGIDGAGVYKHLNDLVVVLVKEWRSCKDDECLGHLLRSLAAEGESIDQVMATLARQKDCGTLQIQSQLYSNRLDAVQVYVYESVYGTLDSVWFTDSAPIIFLHLCTVGDYSPPLAPCNIKMDKPLIYSTRPLDTSRNVTVHIVALNGHGASADHWTQSVELRCINKCTVAELQQAESDYWASRPNNSNWDYNVRACILHESVRTTCTDLGYGQGIGARQVIDQLAFTSGLLRFDNKFV